MERAKAEEAKDHDKSEMEKRRTRGGYRYRRANSC